MPPGCYTMTKKEQQLTSRDKNGGEALPAQNSSDDVAFGELSDLLGYRLRRAQMAMHRDFIAAIAELDLTQKQTAILWLVSNNPGISQAAVASALAMDRPSMMALTDRLQERGFLSRERSRVDRRRQELHLTRAGETMLSRVKARIAEHERRMCARFTDDELAALLAALQKFQP
jgi:DNA-binding MarR family transcriptional regulator